jgi:hypothetical protein
MGPKKLKVGEIKIESQLYQNEFAQTMAKNTFEAEQPEENYRRNQIIQNKRFDFSVKPF